MVLLRKLKTACRVLREFGAGEAFVLLWRNVSLYSTRVGRIAASKARRAFYRLAGRRFEKKDGRPRVLYVVGNMEAERGQTIRYRVFNLREALVGRARTKFEILENGISRDRASLAWADLIVLMRVEWCPDAARLCENARALHIPVVYDIDDIIFLERYFDKFCSVLDFDPERIASVREIFTAQEKTFEQAVYCTASTPYIAEIMRREGKKAYVIHNGLSKKQLRIAEAVRKNAQKEGPRLIGYLSGTMTHNRDFQQALPALARILREYDDVRLAIVGYLDLDVLPPEVRSRVQFSCFMKWSRLLRKSARNTVNLAPLDLSNPFCHAKSELKYYEAAVVGVPTVASATDTFRRCIINGENGFLASNEEEWYRALKTLLDEPETAERVRRGALRHAVSHYAPDAVAGEAAAAYRAILGDAGLQENKRAQPKRS